MHPKGITHRNIKPDNILVATKNPMFIKLADFGLSTEKAELGTICSTPGYAAPELFSEKPAAYTNAVDIWSVGAVIWNLLRGFKDQRSMSTPAYYKKIMYDQDNLSMLFNEWSSALGFGEPPLEQWLRLGDKDALETFSAPCKFYQDRLVERYGPATYTLAKLVGSKYGIPQAKINAKKLLKDLQKMGSSELHRNVLSLLILLERLPYHPRQLSSYLILHFRRLACALAICNLSCGEANRLDFHPDYKFRPEYRCWFYTPLIFSGVPKLKDEGKKLFLQMRVEMEQVGNEAGKVFLDSFYSLYEDAKAAVLIEGGETGKSPQRKAVLLVRALLLLSASLPDFPDSSTMNSFVSPTGGDILISGEPYDIKWTPNTPGPVFIQLSYDGNAIACNVTASTQNTGSFSWTPPGIFGGKDNYFLVICDLNRPQSDCSYTFNGRFSIESISSSGSISAISSPIWSPSTLSSDFSTLSSSSTLSTSSSTDTIYSAQPVNSSGEVSFRIHALSNMFVHFPVVPA
ncbi:hypothetical protein G7Y89_g7698 [Cudoniella acicularis]|uniref:Protein kinase domain-containing protein n=1 Tax=Cudoniella acicularis TaxID=354080 RepID=A0A8H4RKG1_9HELO|nr:hypothetical protein G7Y89_g7698 [Cudoniella acicularis]